MPLKAGKAAHNLLTSWRPYSEHQQKTPNPKSWTVVLRADGGRGNTLPLLGSIVKGLVQVSRSSFGRRGNTHTETCCGSATIAPGPSRNPSVDNDFRPANPAFHLRCKKR
jgi:hypothetical protein